LGAGSFYPEYSVGASPMGAQYATKASRPG